MEWKLLWTHPDLGPDEVYAPLHAVRGLLAEGRVRHLGRDQPVRDPGLVRGVAAEGGEVDVPGGALEGAAALAPEGQAAQRLAVHVRVSNDVVQAIL